MINSNQRIGVGIIGAGEDSWAVKSHLPALKMLSGKFNIVAVSTSNINTAQKTASDFEIPFAFDNEQELVNHPGVELVIVAVKVPAHDKLVKAALSAGKMVYCEWPLGNGYDEAVSMAELAASKQIKTFCGLQSNTLPDLKFLRDYIREGKLGKIYSASVMAGGNNWGPIIESKSLEYLLDPANGATMLQIPFGHMLYALQFILGPVSHYDTLLARRIENAAIENAAETVPQLSNDQIIFRSTHSDGTVCSIHYHGGEWEGINFRWEIYGSKGRLSITSVIGHIQFGKLRLEFTPTGGTSADLIIPEQYQPYDGGQPGLSAELSRGMYYAYSQVYEDIRNSTSFYPDFKEAVKLHELIQYIERYAQR